MRSLRPYVALLSLISIAIACGDDGDDQMQMNNPATRSDAGVPGGTTGFGGGTGSVSGTTAGGGTTGALIGGLTAGGPAGLINSFLGDAGGDLGGVFADGGVNLNAACSLAPFLCMDGGFSLPPGFFGGLSGGTSGGGASGGTSGGGTTGGATTGGATTGGATTGGATTGGSTSGDGGSMAGPGGGFGGPRDAGPG
jgi:hypothetical protein